MELRAYQENDTEKVRHAMKRQGKRVLLQAPCGYGKTILSAELARRTIERGKTVRFLTHRRDLCKQTYAKFEQYGLGDQTGIIMSGFDSHLDRPIQIGTVQTYSRRLNLDESQYNRWFSDVDLIIADECHMFGAPTYKDVLDTHKNAYLLGLSATPYRKGTAGYGLGNMFDVLVNGEPMKNLIRDGYLLPPVHYSLEQDDKKMLRGGLLENWTQHANDRQTIVFAKNVSQSKSICEQFRKFGVSIMHIDSHTPDEEREIIYDGFNNQEIQVLTNCNIATEGSDFPCAGAVVIAKNVSSLPRYLQMSGRPARPYGDQKDYLVLDHSGCASKFGLADDDYEWTLDSTVIAVKNKTSKRERKAITCEACGHLFYYKEKCPMCLTTVVIKNQFVETTDETLVRVGPRKKKATIGELKRWYGMFLHHANEKGYKPGWAAWKWKEKFGEWPKSDYKSGPVEPDEAFLNYQVHLRIKYAKSKKKDSVPEAETAGV